MAKVWHGYNGMDVLLNKKNEEEKEHAGLLKKRRRYKKKASMWGTTGAHRQMLQYHHITNYPSTAFMINNINLALFQQNLNGSTLLTQG